MLCCGGNMKRTLLLMMIMVAGCQTPPGVIFPPVDPPILFPPKPEVTRISWVGQLMTEADLKPGVSGFAAWGEAFFGKNPVRTMLTPFALCTDGKSRLFVADSNAQVVHVFDLETRKYEAWKPGDNRPFSQPVGVAWDPAGKLFVCDSIGAAVFVFDTNGALVSEWGGGRFTRPTGIAVDPARSRILVVDTAAHALVELNTSGEVVRKLGERGVGLGQFNFPTHLTIDRTGKVYVSDTLNFRVVQYSPDLKPIRQIGSHGDLPGYFSQPKGVATDSENHLYVVDAQFESVQVFDDQGRLLMDFGEEGNKPAEFWLPTGIFIDPQDRIWIADSYNKRVQVFDYHAHKATPANGAAPSPTEVKP